MLSLLAMCRAGWLRASSGNQNAPSAPADKIVIDYPTEGSIFPPEITPPTFLFRDGNERASRWTAEVSFADGSRPLLIDVAGEHYKVGEVDPEAGPTGDLLKLTAQQEATRTWKPDRDTWEKIKHASHKSAATVTIRGYSESDSGNALSTGTVTISTSTDPVGAPIFYRDVPLMMWPKTEKGSIQPLPPFAIPLIKWKLRDISQPKSRTVMENLPTCANCHSFSRDGKTLGLDMDGPKNDKGLYALVDVTKKVTIRKSDVFRWSSFEEDPATRSGDPAVKRFGFMSQVSPDGRYVITSIGPPGLKNLHQGELPEFAPGIADRLYSMNFAGPPFNQVFYPTRGVLAFYDRNLGKFRTLPGADDPKYVQTSAFWSPDGKYLIFSRAEARDSYPPGVPQAQYANDPNETQIQYDLYKIPFNEGRGGKPEPVIGASANGMSNNFPKVSPDGRWIVFVQNRNGLLMRPDSKLYIVPFAGGKARLMTCNTSLMNSWHSFSPNGRWLAFSSKARSPYTQLMLTHIDADGNDSPAILIDDMTAANRAVNIPEFVNIPSDGLEHIDPQATEYYRLFNAGFDQLEKTNYTQAVETFRKVVETDSSEALAHYVLATAMSLNGQEGDAVVEYRRACELNPQPAWLDHLAVSLANTGDLEGAVSTWQRSLGINPYDAGAHTDLGTVLFQSGQPEEGFTHLRRAIELAPNFADARNRLGWALAQAGEYEEAIEQLQKAVELRPSSVEFRANLGLVLGMHGDLPGALLNLQKAVEVGEGKDWRALDMLATAYSKAGRPADAAQTEQQALAVAVQQQDSALQETLRDKLNRYRHEAQQGQP